MFKSQGVGICMNVFKKMLLIGLVVCAVLAAPPKKKNSELPLATVILDGKRYRAVYRYNGSIEFLDVSPASNQVYELKKVVVSARKEYKNQWRARLAPLKKAFVTLSSDHAFLKSFNNLRKDMYDYQHDNQVVMRLEDGFGAWHGFVCDRRLAQDEDYDLEVVFKQLAACLALVQLDCSTHEGCVEEGRSSGIIPENYETIKKLKQRAELLIRIYAGSLHGSGGANASAGGDSGVGVGAEEVVGSLVSHEAGSARPRGNGREERADGSIDTIGVRSGVFESGPAAPLVVLPPVAGDGSASSDGEEGSIGDDVVFGEQWENIPVPGPENDGRSRFVAVAIDPVWVAAQDRFSVMMQDSLGMQLEELQQQPDITAGAEGLVPQFCLDCED